MLSASHLTQLHNICIHLPLPIPPSASPPLPLSLSLSNSVFLPVHRWPIISVYPYFSNLNSLKCCLLYPWGCSQRKYASNYFTRSFTLKKFSILNLSISPFTSISPSSPPVSPPSPGWQMEEWQGCQTSSFSVIHQPRSSLKEEREKKIERMEGRAEWKRARERRDPQTNPQYRTFVNRTQTIHLRGRWYSSP